MMRITKVVFHLKRQQDRQIEPQENGGDDGHESPAVDPVGVAIAVQQQQQHEVFDKDQLRQTPDITNQQQQQPIWTQGFEKLLEDPLGLRAFAVSFIDI